MSNEELRAEQQKELAARIQSGETDLIAELWQSVERLVAAKARRLLAAMGDGNRIEFDDLYNSGFLALCAAVKSYKPGTGEFVPWFLLHLKKALAEATGYRTKRDRLDPLRNAVSLSTPIGDEEDGATLGDVTAAPTATVEKVEDAIYLEQLRAALHDAMDCLPENLRDVLECRYWKNLPVQKIAERRGTSESRVSDMAKRGLYTLRRRRGQKLAHFYDFNYHAGTGLGTFRKTGMSVQESYLIRWENIEETREERRAADFKAGSHAENEEVRKSGTFDGEIRKRATDANNG